MSDNPLADVVSRQYEKWRYPAPIEDLQSWPRAAGSGSTRRSLSSGSCGRDREYQPGMDIPHRGCGTNQAAVFAYTNPGANVVAIDISDPSLDHHRYPRRSTGCPIWNCTDFRSKRHLLGREFDLIVSTGVLHHMADPRSASRHRPVPSPDGAMALMLYARFGRAGVR